MLAGDRQIPASCSKIGASDGDLAIVSDQSARGPLGLGCTRPGFQREAVVKRIVLAEGWWLKQIDPLSELDGDLLRESRRGEWGEGWLEVECMPAMVHDVLLAHGIASRPFDDARRNGTHELCQQSADLFQFRR